MAMVDVGNSSLQVDSQVTAHVASLDLRVDNDKHGRSKL